MACKSTTVLHRPELFMGWVDPWVRLGCRVGRVGSRFFSFWWVGLDSVHYSKSTGLLKIRKDYVNALKARLDKIWLHQAVKFYFTANLTGTGNRSEGVIN